MKPNQSTSSNAITSVDNEENGLPELKEAPAPLTYETQKQDKINRQINVDNEILVVLYKKKELNQMTENDRKENKLEILKKKLKDLNLSRKRSKQYRPEHKRKLDALDQITR